MGLAKINLNFRPLCLFVVVRVPPCYHKDCLDIQTIITNKRSDRSMEVKTPTLLGNYDRNYDRETNQDRPGHKVVSLQIITNHCYLIGICSLLKVKTESVASLRL